MRSHSRWYCSWFRKIYRLGRWIIRHLPSTKCRPPDLTFLSQYALKTYYMNTGAGKWTSTADKVFSRNYPLKVHFEAGYRLLIMDWHIQQSLNSIMWRSRPSVGHGRHFFHGRSLHCILCYMPDTLGSSSDGRLFKIQSHLIKRLIYTLQRKAPLQE